MTGAPRGRFLLALILIAALAVPAFRILRELPRDGDASATERESADPEDRDGSLLIPTDPPPPPPAATRGAEFGFVAHSSAVPWIPDCALAVGVDHVVVPVNGRVRFFTKAGTMVQDQPLWGPGGFFTFDPDSGFVFDPVALFDPHSGRFVVAAARRQPERIYVAVSDDGDPTGTWYEYEFDTGSLGTDTDFPCLGVDATTVYVTVKMEGTAVAQRGKYVLLFEKAPMLTGGTPVIASRLLSAASASLVFSGVTTYDPDAPAQYFASSPSPPQTGSSTLRLSALRDPLGAATLDTFDLPISAWFWKQLVPELGNPTGVSNEPGHFLKHGVYRNGSLWVTHTVSQNAAAARTVVRWYEIAMNGWPQSGNEPTLRQWGAINLGSTAGGSPISAFYADVAVDALGDAAFVFHRSSAEEYVGIMRGYRRFDDPAGAVPDLVPWRQGTAPASDLERWGDYVSMDEDPAQPGTFWGHAEYRDGIERRTWVGSFTGSVASGVALAGEGGATADVAAPRPNPFDGTTSLRLVLPRAAGVRVTVHDVAGRRIRTLRDAATAAGAHEIPWDGRDEQLAPVPGGVYFLRVESDGDVQTRKVTFVR